MARVISLEAVVSFTVPPVAVNPSVELLFVQLPVTVMFAVVDTFAALPTVKLLTDSASVKLNVPLVKVRFSYS